MTKTKNRAPGATGNPAENETIDNNFSDFTGESQDVKQAAPALLQNRLSVIPANPTTKKPTLSWKPYQAALMSRGHVVDFTWPGIAVICGKISGQMETLDFDYKAALFDEWAALVEAEAPGLIARLTRQSTQSGGKHIIYRCPGVTIPGNTKLASERIEFDGPGDHDFMGKTHRAQKDGDRWFIYPCYIETRGEGGYFLAAPTEGYHLERGDFQSLAEVTPGERDLLIRAAKALDKAAKPTYHKQPTIDGTRPGDHYNQETDPRPLLEKHGWTSAGSKGDFEHWTRPGKQRGISASLIDGKLFNCFTTNGAPLEEKVYTPFALYATLEHSGDFEAAARALRLQGYGGGLAAGAAPNTPPEPLPLIRKNDEGEPFPVDALGEIMGPAAQQLIRIIQAPDAVCAQSLLSTVALCVQPFADVLIDGRRMPVSEYFISICPSGGRKSAADAVATAEVRKWEEAALKEYTHTYKAYRDGMDAYEQQKKKILSSKKMSLEDQNKELARLRDVEPELPFSPTVLMSDGTYEGVVKSFIYGVPSKAVFADEGGLFSGGFSMSQEKILYSAAGYSKFWDGGRIDRIRAGSETDALYGRRLTMHLMMQDGVAADFFGNPILADQGLTSRILVSCPLSRVGTRHYVEADPSTTPEIQVFHSRIRDLLNRGTPLKRDRKTGRILNELELPAIELSPAAKRLWIDFYHAVEENCGDGRLFETIPGFSSKAAEHCLRLAGIMSLFENPDSRVIDDVHIERGTALVQYYLNERVRIRAMAAPDQTIMRAQELLKWLTDRGKKTVLLPEIYQYGPGRLRTAVDARKAVKTLEDHFYLVPVKGSKKEEWQVR